MKVLHLIGYAIVAILVFNIVLALTALGVIIYLGM